MADPSDTQRWQVAAASIIGPDHAKEGVGCQDAHFVGEADNGIALAAVSDGAGSTKLGGEAAAIICRQFEALWESLVRLSFGHGDAESPASWWAVIEGIIEETLTAARESLLVCARESEVDPSDLLATVVGVVAHPDCGAVTFHIGDGAATVFNSDCEEIFTSQPENGEYLNLTYFLVEEHWRDHLRIKVVPLPFDEMAVMTDGVTDLAYVRHGRRLVPEPRFFQPLSAFLRERTRIVGEEALTRALNTQEAQDRVGDDKTLIWMRIADNASTK